MTTLVASCAPTPTISSSASLSTITITSAAAAQRRSSPLRNGRVPSTNSLPTMSSATSTPRHPRSSPHSNASPDLHPREPRRSPPSRTVSDSKTSPNALRAPTIKVKKEPTSPNMSARPRPRRLDLSASASARQGPYTAGAGPSAPLTSKESAGLAIKDLGVACLSPGFQTQDPTLREQLQRSLSVRDQQRQLIEARQKGITKPLSTHEGSEPARTAEGPSFGSEKEPQSSRRKGPPPGLSIHAPSASSFANERVIQSAPLHQSFTGLRPGGAHPHQPSALSQTSHIHHVPATQTSNRLPPISDVFPSDRFEAPSSASYRHGFPAQPSPSYPPPMQSPGFPPPPSALQQPGSSRSREYRSAEEAVQGMTGGREDLLPKIVHYGGVQPPTPPSPMPPHNQQQQPQHNPHQSHLAANSSSHHMSAPSSSHHYDSRPDLSRTSSMSGRRRGRDEYERENGSPSNQQGEPKRYAREGEDWRAGMNSAQKREEFLRLCERAWDLFHS